MSRNGTQHKQEMLKFSKEEELAAYELLPSDLREVVRNAPFAVSVCDMLANAAVVRELQSQGDNAAKWLSENLETVYRTKILPQALKKSSS